MSGVRVGVVGGGVIGSQVGAALEHGVVAGCMLAGLVPSRVVGPGAITELADGCDVLVEAAGVAAVAPLLELVADSHRRLVICSTGAFAEPELERRLADPRIRSHMVFPAGAIGGIDTLSAIAKSGCTARVRLVTTKQPAALSSGDRVPRCVFAGTARQAVHQFPRTANVAATLALAGGGFDEVRVEVHADPEAHRTRHEVTIDSELGDYRFVFDNVLSEGSGGRTSAITVWSVLNTIEQAVANVMRSVPNIPGLTKRGE